MSNKEFWVVKLPSNNKLLKNTQCKYNSKNQLQQTGGLIKELVELCQNTKVIRDQNSQPLSELSRGGGSDSQEPLAAAVAVETRRPTGPRIYAFHFNQAGQERLSCRRVKEKGGWETTGDGGEKLWLNPVEVVEVEMAVKGGGGYGGGMVAKNKAVVATNKAQPRRSDGGGDHGRGVGGYRSRGGGSYGDDGDGDRGRGGGGGYGDSSGGYGSCNGGGGYSEGGGYRGESGGDDGYGDGGYGDGGGGYEGGGNSGGGGSNRDGSGYSSGGDGDGDGYGYDGGCGYEGSNGVERNSGGGGYNKSEGDSVRDFVKTKIIKNNL
ncbi:unnamed protein product [Brassica oleracea]